MSVIFIVMESEPGAVATGPCYGRRNPALREARSLPLLVLTSFSMIQQALRLVLFQRLRRLFHACRQRSFRKCLKVEQACISPDDRVAFLNRQLLRDRLVTLVIDDAFQRSPLLPRRSHPLHSALIVERHLVPKRPAGAQAIVPAYVMKPEQIFFRARFEFTETVAHCRLILRDSVAAGRGAIKSHACFVRAMKVNRVPIVPLFLAPPWRRSVMMPTPKKMMQPQRRHVIDDRFGRLEHDARNRAAAILIACQSHGNPFFGNLFRREIWIPCQPPEGIPVGLQKMMTRPVAI